MTLERDTTNVLSSFRTSRRDLWEWGAVNEYVFEAELGVELLRDMVDDYGAAGVIPGVQKAIASTFRVLMRADDSGGSIQLVIADLLTLHAELCAETPPSTAALCSWMQKQQFGELGEYFSIDVVDYEEALGTRGVARFEAQLMKRREALTTPFDGRPELAFQHDSEWHARDALLTNLQRLSVLHADQDAIVRSHGGDLPRAHLRAETAVALREAGFMDRATTVAHEGMMLDGAAHQQRACGALWRDLLIELGDDGAESAAAEVFERWPSASALHEWSQIADDWAARREGALVTLRGRPGELVSFLVESGDVQRAWDEAALATRSGRSLLAAQWDDLVAAYRALDPVAVLPVMAQLIDDRLAVANTKAYPGAVRRMRELRKHALAAGRPEIASEYLADLRIRFARRPALIARMDAARV